MNRLLTGIRLIGMIMWTQRARSYEAIGGGSLKRENGWSDGLPKAFIASLTASSNIRRNPMLA